MMVYQQELSFLRFAADLMSGKRAGPAEEPQDGRRAFKGLSLEGQLFLKELLSSKVMAHLLETGGSVQGTAVTGGRQISCSVFSPLPGLRFTRNLYSMLLTLFDPSHPLPDTPDFSPADEVVLNALLEDQVKVNACNLPGEWTASACANALLPAVCGLDGNPGIDTDFQSLITRFFGDDAGSHLFFFLRFTVRDQLLRQFDTILQHPDPGRISAYGRSLEQLLSGLFRNFTKNGSMELFDPFCQLFDTLFQSDLSRIIESSVIEKQNLDYEADKAKIRARLAPLFSWTEALNAINEEAVKTRAWDENVNAMNRFKRSFSAISGRARENAQKTMAYLENIL